MLLLGDAHRASRLIGLQVYGWCESFLNFNLIFFLDAHNSCVASNRCSHLVFKHRCLVYVFLNCNGLRGSVSNRDREIYIWRSVVPVGREMGSWGPARGPRSSAPPLGNGGKWAVGQGGVVRARRGLRTPSDYTAICLPVPLKGTVLIALTLCCAHPSYWATVTTLRAQ